MSSNKLTLEDGHTYVVGYAPTSEALAAGARLLNMLGPALDGFRGGFMGAIGGLLRDPSLGDHTIALAKTFAKYTQVSRPDGGTVTLSEVFEVHFQGRLGAFAKWIEFAVKVNLSDFLGVLSEKLGEAQDAASSPSKPPNPAGKTG